jgi:hypothetical protein
MTVIHPLPCVMKCCHLFERCADYKRCADYICLNSLELVQNIQLRSGSSTAAKSDRSPPGMRRICEGHSGNGTLEARERSMGISGRAPEPARPDTPRRNRRPRASISGLRTVHSPPYLPYPLGART